MNKKVGIAGLGAMGITVARALQKGIPGLSLHAVCEPRQIDEFSHIIHLQLEDLPRQCDLIVECLPAAIVPELARAVFKNDREMIVISTAALIIYPEILKQQRSSRSRIIIPSGAIAGLDGVRALAQSGIKAASIMSTKHPRGYEGAPYIEEREIDLGSITEKKKIFSGNAFEAAKAFPANVNVAATLSLAGIGPEKTQVEVWADPTAKGNTHEIRVEGKFSTLTCKVENTPDPANPKTSMLAAQSIISVLQKQAEPLVIL